MKSSSLEARPLFLFLSNAVGLIGSSFQRGNRFPARGGTHVGGAIEFGS